MSQKFIDILIEADEKEEQTVDLTAQKFTKYLNVWFDFLNKINNGDVPSRLPFRDKESDILFIIDTYAKKPELRTMWITRFVNPLMKMFHDENIPNQSTLIKQLRNIQGAEGDPDHISDMATVVLAYTMLIILDKLIKMKSDEESQLSPNDATKIDRYTTELDSAFSNMVGRINRDKSRALLNTMINRNKDLKDAIYNTPEFKTIKSEITNPSSATTKERFYKQRS